MRLKGINKYAKIIIGIGFIAVGYYVYTLYLKPKTNTYYVYFNQIKGLQTSSHVLMKGVTIGKVKSIELTNNNKLSVTLVVDSKIKLYENAKAALGSGSLTGDNTISIINGAGKTLPTGTTLLNAINIDDSGNVSQKKNDLPAIKAQIQNIDTSFAHIRTYIKNDLSNKVSGSVTSMQKSMSRYAVIAEDANKKMNGVSNTIDNTNKLSSNLSVKSKKMQATFESIENTTIGIKDSSIQTSFSSLKKNIKNLSAISNNKTLHKHSSDNAVYINTTKSLDTSKINKLKNSPKTFSIIGKSK